MYQECMYQNLVVNEDNDLLMVIMMRYVYMTCDLHIMYSVHKIFLTFFKYEKLEFLNLEKT